MITPLNKREQIRHKLRNRLQSIFLLAGMAVLLSLCGWTIAGGEGIFWALGAGGISLVFGPQVSPWLTLRLYRAIPIHPAEMPAVFQILGPISARAGLPHPPRLYYVPTRVLNAFAVGR
jgi:heat shock protein HtpX